MSDIATAVGSMFVGMGGEVVASCSKASHSKGRGVHPLFADTAPLAKIREETRSNKEGVADIVRPVQAGEPEDMECPADLRDSTVSGNHPRPESEDGATEPAEEETAPLEVASLAGEVGAATDAPDVASSPGIVEVVGVPTTIEVDPVDVSGTTVNADVSLASEHQSLSMVAQTTADDGRAFSQVQTDATIETADGQQHSLQSEVTVSVDKGNVEVSAKVLVADHLPNDASDNAKALPVQTATSEGTKMAGADTAAVVVKEQTSELPDTPAKAVLSEPEVTDTPEAATVEVATKPQGQVRSEVQVSAEDSKEPGLDKAAIASRGSQTPQRGSDNMPREDAQTPSQQDRRIVSQGGVQVMATPEPDKQATVPGFKDLVQPQAELTAVSQNEVTDASARLSAQTPGSPGLGAAATKSPVQDVGEQILSSVHASLARADKQVQIRLDPPELGSVLVRLTEQGDQIRGFLEVSRDETRREIEQALPQVLKGLQEAGVQVRRLEVVVSDQPDRGVGREQSQQDAWAQQHQPHSDQQGYRPQNASAMNWSAQTGFQQNRAGRDELQAQGAQDRIDMLV